MIAAKSTTAFDKIHLLQVEWDTADLEEQSCDGSFTTNLVWWSLHIYPTRAHLGTMSIYHLPYVWCFCVSVCACVNALECMCVFVYSCMCVCVCVLCMLLCVPEVVCVSLVCWFKWPSLSAVYNSLWECVFSTNHFPLYLLLIIIKDSNFSLYFFFISKVYSFYDLISN